MTLHTLRTLAALSRRKPGAAVPAPALSRLARFTRITPAAVHLVTTMGPVVAGAIRRLARFFRPVA